MKKIIALLMLSISFVFAAINLQTASKEELMSIKGIGEQKALAIMEYRKTHKLKSADDLLAIKGIGAGIVENVKKDVKVSSAKKTAKAKTSKASKKLDNAKTKTTKKVAKTKAKANKKVAKAKTKASKKAKKVEKKTSKKAATKAKKQVKKQTKTKK